MSSPLHLEFRLLGRAQIILDGQDITTDVGAKPLAFVAYLALHAPAPVAREKLAGTFWTDKSDEAARYRLRHTLWELRRQLGKEHLQADEEKCWLSLDRDIRVDVNEFQTTCHKLKIETHQYQPAARDVTRLKELAELYRGEFLDHLLIRDAPLFEEWQLVERERLQLMYQELLWSFAHAQQSAKDNAGAAQTFAHLINVDPLRERNYRALMGLYLRMGDRGAALQVYKQCASKLAAELGVAPSPGTEQLREAIARPTAESAADLIGRIEKLIRDARYEDALAACAVAEGLANDPLTASQVALLRAEIALASGKKADSLSLIQSARQTILKLFAP